MTVTDFLSCDVILSDDDAGLAIAYDGPVDGFTGLKIDSIGLWLVQRRGLPLRLGQALDETSRQALLAQNRIAVAFVPADGGEPTYRELPINGR